MTRRRKAAPPAPPTATYTLYFYLVVFDEQRHSRGLLHTIHCTHMLTLQPAPGDVIYAVGTARYRSGKAARPPSDSVWDSFITTRTGDYLNRGIEYERPDVVIAALDECVALDANGFFRRYPDWRWVPVNATDSEESSGIFRSSDADSTAQQR